MAPQPEGPLPPWDLVGHHDQLNAGPQTALRLGRVAGSLGMQVLPRAVEVGHKHVVLWAVDLHGKAQLLAVAVELQAAARGGTPKEVWSSPREWLLENGLEEPTALLLPGRRSVGAPRPPPKGMREEDPCGVAHSSEHSDPSRSGERTAHQPLDDEDWPSCLHLY